MTTSDRPPAAPTAGAADARPLLLFVHQGGDWVRGAEQCMLDLLERLDRSRFRLLLWCTSPTVARAAERLGVETMLERRWRTSVVHALLMRPRVRRVLRGRGVALIHANAPNPLGVLTPLARALRIPLLVHVHVRYDGLRARLRRLVREAPLVVGVAEHVVATLRGTAADREGRVRVLLNAVNVDRLAGGDATGLRATLGIPADACVALAIGSLIPLKGHDVTIAAVARARARGAPLHLVVCGDGCDEGALRAGAAALGVDGAVHFLGMRPDVGAILRDVADLLVTSAREEALGLNVLEAQALGVPVVATDIPGHREALDDGRSAVLVPPDAPDALADALVALADDPARRVALAAAGRANVAARFAMARYVREFTALYEEMLAAPERSARTDA